MREADLLALHERFPDRYPVLLESVSGEESLGRQDVLFALPGERLAQLPDGSLAGDVREAAAGGRFLDALDRWIARERGADDAAPNEAVFASGWFLYLGYELAGEIEPTLRLPGSPLAHPHLFPPRQTDTSPGWPAESTPLPPSPPYSPSRAAQNWQNPHLGQARL